MKVFMIFKKFIYRKLKKTYKTIEHSEVIFLGVVLADCVDFFFIKKKNIIFNIYIY